MKKLVMIISLMLAISMIPVPPAMAETISPGNYVKLVAYNPSDNAGIMTYGVSYTDDGTVDFYYDTFCIQQNVYVWLNQWYPVADVSDQVGYVGPHVSLNGVVDYLFYRYKSGAYDTWLNMATYEHTNEADLQRLLWSLQEGAVPPYPPSGSAPWTLDMTNYHSQSSLQHPWGTKVINIVSKNGRYDIQNQLYNQVPEPTTMLLLGLGLLGLAGARRNIVARAGRK